MITIRKAKDDGDIRGILVLQKRYLKSPEREEEDWSDGFVTLQHTPAILRKMMGRSPQIIAVAAGEVVGYSLGLRPEMASMFPLLDPMMEAFEDIVIDGKKLTDHSYIIGGQCCIEEEYRGKGLLKKLYEGTREAVDCDFCVTEIARSNPRSLNAHLKIGFSVVHEYEGAGHMWDVVLWDWRK